MQKWSSPPLQPLALLTDETVHVWLLSLREPPIEFAELAALLNSTETARAQRFVFAKDREDFTVARGMLRVILAKYLNVDSKTIRFEYDRYSKPSLIKSSDHPHLHFNVSHSHGYALYALSLKQAVGVDIEFLERKNDSLIDIAKRFFSASEYEQLITLPDSEHIAAFYRIWTRKEAFIKAIGQGLSHPLDTFAVNFTLDQPASFVSIANDDPAQWSLFHLDPLPNYFGAVAIRQKPIQLICWEWSRIIYTS